ncbi:MAG: Beta-lactamase superfamily domain protein [Syntrophorhabdus sp. PtaU1.Bin153]|nr:MAG: Beta-lactamase superfamily domain protein [Syntrophorhabdus sp. PtaU1.Bin153]
MKPTIDQLEDINAIVDVCIDRELYELLDEMMSFSKAGNDLLKKDVEKLGSKKWDSKKTKEIIYQMYEVSKEFPTVQISIPTSFEGIKSGVFTFRHGEKDDWLQQWSCLFWIKTVRAVLQKKNKEPWISGFDDVVGLLEANIPKINPASKHTMYARKKTVFAFLMELSASARDEASNGYAERARYLVPSIVGTKPEDKKERDKYGTRYDRWIWYNMGLAYQHSGLHHKAVLEFNRVISKFWDWVSYYDKNPDDPRSALEFVFVVLPCVLQRASISLQLQLGYHALEAMEESNKVNANETETLQAWLDTLSLRQGFFAQCINNYLEQKSIFQIEALLQLERYNYSGTQAIFNEKMQALWKSKLHETWTSTQTKLPALSRTPSKRLGSHVKLIEQTVAWFLQEAKELATKIKSFSKTKDGQFKEEALSTIPADIEKLIERMDTVKDTYWHWVEGNSFDEHIYFSEWGKFLNVSAGILEVFRKLKHSQAQLKGCIKDLLICILKFYGSQKQRMPVPRSLRICKDYSKSLRLENLRSDDLPDFADGLKSFYEVMARILVDKNGKETDNAKAMFECIEEYLRSVGNASPIEYFKKVHLRLLDALDEYEKEFSEARRITFLDRCNERLKWVEQGDVSTSRCQGCLSPDNLPYWSIIDSSEQPLSPGAFGELLRCEAVCSVKLQPDSNKDTQLNHDNYETIMHNAELDFTRHFREVSAHLPQECAYHFLGLQRWNSLTPAQGKSVGGGYFIYRTGEDGKIDLGIAIDPGFDFVRNFLRMGFSLRDIDIVMISHAHADHLWDFESIVQLLNEMRGKIGETRRVDVILTLGVYSRFKHVINNSTLRKHINPLVIDIRKEIDPDFLNLPFRFRKLDGTEKPSRWGVVLPGDMDSDGQSSMELVINATRAYHEDYSDESDSFGFLLTFKEGSSSSGNTDVCFGYTGDTKWVGNDLYSEGCPFKIEKNYECSCSPICNDNIFESVASQYRDCDVVLTHIGSLIKHKSSEKFEDYKNPSKCEELIRKENHPYLFGMIRLLKELRSAASSEEKSKDKLILLGEFGEELRGGIRYDIVNRFRTGILDGWPILPVDVGLDIWMKKENKSNGQSQPYHKALCVMCEQYHPIDKIKFYRFGHDEAIFYFCETCFKSTPEDVRDAKLQHIYDVGWELKNSI